VRPHSTPDVRREKERKRAKKGKNNKATMRKTASVVSAGVSGSVDTESSCVCEDMLVVVVTHCIVRLLSRCEKRERARKANCAQRQKLADL